jgi:hypothetical protein
MVAKVEPQGMKERCVWLNRRENRCNCTWARMERSCVGSNDDASVDEKKGTERMGGVR